MSALLLRWFFVALLAASGIAKLADMRGFIEVASTYKSLPIATVPIAAWALTIAEIGIAAWLAVGIRLRAAALAVVLMHLLYFGWIALALARGLDLANCGCFGVYFARALGWNTLVEDALLLTMAIALSLSLKTSRLCER